MKTALVVDDDAVSRLVLSHMLVAQDFVVSEASTVDEALECVEEKQRLEDRQAFDLIICDYVMPNRDGLDFLEALGSSSPPFILLTGHADRESLSDTRVDGVSSYLTKPISTDELIAAVDQVLYTKSA